MKNYIVTILRENRVNKKISLSQPFIETKERLRSSSAAVAILTALEKVDTYNDQYISVSATEIK